jgi:surface protein
LKVVKRLVVDTENATGFVANGLFSDCNKLESLDISGLITTTSTATSSVANILKSITHNSIVNLDLSKLSIDVPCLMSFLSSGNSSSITEVIDIRGVDLTHTTYMYRFMGGQSSLKTLIVGNFTNSALSSSSTSGKMTEIFHNVLSLETLVCTKQTPPTLVSGDCDFIALLKAKSSVFDTILVPPNCLYAYQQASGWSTYSSMMSEYNEGDY